MDNNGDIVRSREYVVEALRVRKEFKKQNRQLIRRYGLAEASWHSEQLREIEEILRHVVRAYCRLRVAVRR